MVATQSDSQHALEFLIVYPSQSVPVYVIHWMAVLNTRIDIVHEAVT